MMRGMSNDSSGRDPSADGELNDEDLFLEPEELVDPPMEDPLLGRVLNGRFELIRLIGEGGMGRVYEAVQSPLGRRVAIKVLHPTLPVSSDPHFQRRFLQEAALTARLHSPNTVSMLDYGQTEDGIYYLAMEYLEGDTLLQTLQRDGALPWEQVVQLTQQICRSLKEAHALGVVHRDLKPANVILVRDGDQVLAKVLDFGLVKTISAEPGQVDPEITQRGTFLGSPTYMSPEQARNESDTRSDVYSLGVLTFHMLIGRPPFVSSDYVELLFAHHRQPPPSFKHLRPDLDIPASLEAVVRKCMEKAPDARYQSMDELITALREAGVAAGLQSGIFKASVTGVHVVGPGGSQPRPGPSQSGSHGDPGPLFSAFTRADAETMHALESGGGEESTRAYTLKDDLGVVLAERVKNQPANRKVWLIALALLLLVLVGAGAWALVGRGGAESESEAMAKAELPLPASGAVRFRVLSEPAGARVMLEGKEKGITPFMLELMPDDDGIATVELTFLMDGYQPDTVVTGGSGDVVIMRKLEEVPRTASRRRAPRRTRTAPAVATSRPEETPTPEPAKLTELPEGTAIPTGATAAVTASRQTGAGRPVDVLPFTADMEPPLRIEGPSLAMPRAARTAGVKGTMIFKCTISDKGTVSNCRTIKTLPFMEEEVLRYITSGLYRPVMFNGAPVSVDYVFNVRIEAAR